MTPSKNDERPIGNQINLLPKCESFIVDVRARPNADICIIYLEWDEIFNRFEEVVLSWDIKSKRWWIDMISLQKKIKASLINGLT